MAASAEETRLIVETTTGRRIWPRRPSGRGKPTSLIVILAEGPGGEGGGGRLQPLRAAPSSPPP